MKLAITLLISLLMPTASAYSQVREGNLKPGDPAPDFFLKLRGSEQWLRLSDFQGQKPVALVFGSFT